MWWHGDVAGWMIWYVTVAGSVTSEGYHGDVTHYVTLWHVKKEAHYAIMASWNVCMLYLCCITTHPWCWGYHYMTLQTYSVISKPFKERYQIWILQKVKAMRRHVMWVHVMSMKSQELALWHHEVCNFLYIYTICEKQLTLWCHCDITNDAHAS